MSHKIFHFTLGPVQGFVAQARRTRDLWAGSFLLSWLAGRAMESVLRQNDLNVIAFPDVGTLSEPKDPLLAAILKKEAAVPPSIGSIPNRFKARVTEDFNPDAVGTAVQCAWKKLCEIVYGEFVEEIADKHGNKTKDIWDRQIKSFWEINWILGDDPGDSTDDSWLDLRKNWRDHWPEPEKGDHCTIMGDFQEISGHIRSRPDEKLQQEEFWQELQGQLGRLEIRDSERLCAISLVKRLFPKLKEEQLRQTIGWVPGGVASSVGNWPSTTYMAVVPWLRHICNEPKHIDGLKEYIQHVQRKTGDWFKVLASEWAVKLEGLEVLRTISVGGKNLDAIDGDLLHYYALKNHRTTYLSRTRPQHFRDDPDQKNRAFLLEELKKLHEMTQMRPRSFYALLLMDGDHMGKLLRLHDQGTISRALLAFNGHVPNIVKKHEGVTIYAGGDDVLALLPLDCAIVCAEELRQNYTDCFTKEQNPDPTISGAIVFAHHQLPLQDVVGTAHGLLDKKAKAENGRQSLALAVLKSSGITAEWVNVWGQKPSPVAALLELIEKMARTEDYPRGFFHKLRDRYVLLTDENTSQELKIDLRKVLIAEYLKTVGTQTSLQQAEQAVDLLLKASNRYRRVDDCTATNGADRIVPCRELQLGAGFISRFLTQEED